MIISKECTFSVPEDRVKILLQQTRNMLKEGECSLKELEKYVGKCRSMAVAVPCAILYMRTQYTLLARNINYKEHPKAVRKRTRNIDSSLQTELQMWSQLSTPLINGSPWLKASHIRVQLNLKDASSDASSRRWGGSFSTSQGTFETGGEFPIQMLTLHINVKEAWALLWSLQNFCQNDTLMVRGKIFIVKVDNQVLFHIYENRAPQNKWKSQTFVSRYFGYT